MEKARGKCSLVERSKPFFILVLAALFIIASATFAFSQTDPYQSIRGVKFKDGSVIMGTVTQMNVETVTIRLDNGQTVVRKFDDVDTFIKRDDAVKSYQETIPAGPATAPAAAPVAAPAAASPSAVPSTVKESSLSGSIYESRSIPSEAKIGGYFGVFGGYTLSPNASYERSSYSFDLDVQETWALGIKIGHTPPHAKYFSFEFEFSYLNPDIDRTVLAQSGTNYVSIDEADAKFYNFMFNVIAKYPEGKVHPYLGVGIGLSYVEVNGTLRGRIGGINYTEYDSDNDTAFAWQILAGVDIDLTSNMVLDLGYRYFYTKPQFEVTEIEYKTSMFTLGLKFLF